MAGEHPDRAERAQPVQRQSAVSQQPDRGPGLRPGERRSARAATQRSGAQVLVTTRGGRCGPGGAGAGIQPACQPHFHAQMLLQDLGVLKIRRLPAGREISLQLTAIQQTLAYQMAVEQTLTNEPEIVVEDLAHVPVDVSLVATIDYLGRKIPRKGATGDGAVDSTSDQHVCGYPQAQLDQWLREQWQRPLWTDSIEERAGVERKGADSQCVPQNPGRYSACELRREPRVDETAVAPRRRHQFGVDQYSLRPARRGQGIPAPCEAGPDRRCEQCPD